MHDENVFFSIANQLKMAGKTEKVLYCKEIKHSEQSQKIPSSVIPYDRVKIKMNTTKKT